MSPEGSYFILSSNILFFKQSSAQESQKPNINFMSKDLHDSEAHPYVELYVLISDRFDIESDCWNGCDGLIELELVQNGCK